MQPFHFIPCLCVAGLIYVLIFNVYVIRLLMQTCHFNSFNISEVYISASHILTRSHMYKFNNKTYHYLVLSHTQFLNFNIETEHFSHIFHTHISSNEGDITCFIAFNVATFSINYLFCNFFGFDNSLIVICINS